MRIIIVGAGPAGLFAAKELLGKAEVLLFDEGKAPLERSCPEIDYRVSCNKCKPCSIMHGVGGAGLFSDGKLNFTPILSQETLFEFVESEKVYELMDYIDQTFMNYGMNSPMYPLNMDNALKLKSESARHGIDYKIRKQKHVGSDALPKIINSFLEEMKSSGLKPMLSTAVKDIIIKGDEVLGVKTSKGEVRADAVILCPGRGEAIWLKELCEKYGIKNSFQPIWVGVRVETLASIMNPITEQVWEPFFLMHTRKYDDLMRTFCVCPNGFVAQEVYENFVCVNGYSSKGVKSENTNFALLEKVSLTEPVEDTIKYGESIARLATTIGGGKPVLQRLADLKIGRRSTWNRVGKSTVKASLKQVTPGDISMALPHRNVQNILEALECLDKVMPGINGGNTLLYAPEVKFSSVRVKTDKGLETSMNNLFVAGDGAGVSGNIVGAAATGIIAARRLIEKNGL